MTYREQLKKVNELGINICDLTIANECDCVFEFQYTDAEFEKLCALAVEAYLKSEYVSSFSLALAINNMITIENKTIEQVLALSVWDLIYKSEY